uniref:Uncharacterized protein n=1 Tax=Rhizophora mucronata TaxID=61149 RepID=A0A2P2Q845_RHIMU
MIFTTFVLNSRFHCSLRVSPRIGNITNIVFCEVHRLECYGDTLRIVVKADATWSSVR